VIFIIARTSKRPRRRVLEGSSRQAGTCRGACTKNQQQYAESSRRYPPGWSGQWLRRKMVDVSATSSGDTAMTANPDGFDVPSACAEDERIVTLAATCQHGRRLSPKFPERTSSRIAETNSVSPRRRARPRGPGPIQSLRCAVRHAEDLPSSGATDRGLQPLPVRWWPAMYGSLMEEVLRHVALAGGGIAIGDAEQHRRALPSRRRDCIALMRVHPSVEGPVT